MTNFYESVLNKPEYYRQFNCGDSLITLFNCPLEARLMETRFTELWSRYNYILYVTEGRKVWHTAHGSYDLRKGSCVFVRKGACIIEQFFDVGFCVVLFFIPDEFLCETLTAKSTPLSKAGKNFESLMVINTTPTLEAYFL